MAKKKLKIGCCEDCERNTYALGEYYMVHDFVWYSVARDGMLCVGCLEKRLKRKLTFKDFLFCPLNMDAAQGLIRASRRLIKRMLI